MDAMPAIFVVVHRKRPVNLLLLFTNIVSASHVYRHCVPPRPAGSTATAYRGYCISPVGPCSTVVRVGMATMHMATCRGAGGMPSPTHAAAHTARRLTDGGVFVHVHCKVANHNIAPILHCVFLRANIGALRPAHGRNTVPDRGPLLHVSADLCVDARGGAALNIGLIGEAVVAIGPVADAFPGNVAGVHAVEIVEGRRVQLAEFTARHHWQEAKPVCGVVWCV